MKSAQDSAVFVSSPLFHVGMGIKNKINVGRFFHLFNKTKELQPSSSSVSVVSPVPVSVVPSPVSVSVVSPVSVSVVSSVSVSVSVVSSVSPPVSVSVSSS